MNSSTKAVDPLAMESEETATFDSVEEAVSTIESANVRSDTSTLQGDMTKRAVRSN